jgi:folylpolyglutamate synthase/dihydropteroate synthase
MLRALSVVSDEIVVTESSSGRVLPAAELGELAGGKFARVHVAPEPGRVVERARKLAGTGGAVLVTGSLYLLADLYKEENVRWRTSATG